MAKSDAMDIVKKNAVSIAAGVVALVALAAIFFYVDPQFEDLQAKVDASKDTDSKLRGQISKPRNVPSIDREGGRGEGVTLVGFPTRGTVGLAREMMANVDAQADGVLAEANRISRRLPLLFQPEGPFADGEAYAAAFEQKFAEAAAAWPFMGEPGARQRDQWQREYQRVINADGSFNDDSGDYPAGTLQAGLNATRPPTAESMEIAQEIRATRVRAEFPKDDQGQPLDPEGLDVALQEARQQLARGLKNNRALRHRIYIDESGSGRGLSVHPAATADPVTAKEVFEAQVQLWVQQEVLQAIGRANDIVLRDEDPGQQNVLRAPVKQIVHLNVPNAFVIEGPIAAPEEKPATNAPGGGPGFNPYGGPGGFSYGGEFGGSSGYDPGAGYAGMGQGASDGAGSPTPAPSSSGGDADDTGPEVSDDGVFLGGRREQRNSGTGAPAQALTDVPVDPAAKLDPAPMYSSTARKLHTPFYDIVQFSLRLRVDAEKLPFVLQQLQTDNFVTVLNVFEMTPVDPLVALREGYIFGSEPVVEVALQCEMVFLREWLAEFMPEETRQELQPWSATE